MTADISNSGSGRVWPAARRRRPSSARQSRRRSAQRAADRHCARTSTELLAEAGISVVEDVVVSPDDRRRDDHATRARSRDVDPIEVARRRLELDRGRSAGHAWRRSS